VTPADIQNLVAEIRAIRRMQGEILQMQTQMLTHLKNAPPPPAVATTTPGPAAADQGAAAKSEAEPAPAEPPEKPRTGPPPIPRVRPRRKTVLIVDDDEEAIAAAVASLEQAQIPIRTVRDGNAALSAMAESKPDVLVLELDIGEPMSGKDLVNYVKATMEWVDIPIVLYTRVAVENQTEARTVHGADEVVLKGAGAPEALLNRVIYLFQHR